MIVKRLAERTELLLRSLGAGRAIGILRGCPPRHVVSVTSAAVHAGFGAVEVTLDSRGALQSIDKLTAAFPNLAIGAGTVRTLDDVSRAASAGATFIVSPVVDHQIIGTCADLAIPILPGAATPTEVSRALSAGVGGVKLFPAVSLGGPEYIAAILEPLGNPRLVPIGGISTDNGRDFLDAGATALGVGGSVFKQDALARGDAEQIGTLATAFVRSIT